MIGWQRPFWKAAIKFYKIHEKEFSQPMELSKAVQF